MKGTVAKYSSHESTAGKFDTSLIYGSEGYGKDQDSLVMRLASLSCVLQLQNVV